MPKRHIVAILVGLIYGAFALAWFIPLQENVLQLQSILQTLSLPAIGTWFIVLPFLLSWFDPPVIPSITLGILFLIQGVILIVIVENPNNWRKLTRIVAILLMFAGASCAVYFTWTEVQFPGFEPELQASLICPLPQGAEARINTYEMSPSADNLDYFYSFRKEETDPWQQLLYIRYHDYAYFAPSCNAVRLLNDEFFWVWSEKEVAITKNGGREWYTWSPYYDRSLDLPTWGIFQVGFTTENSGNMRIGGS